MQISHQTHNNETSYMPVTNGIRIEKEVWRVLKTTQISECNSTIQVTVAYILNMAYRIEYQSTNLIISVNKPYYDTRSTIVPL
ncbi:hypothetical protein VTH8203_03037 [Vibrio thalassae]|uniref:Uncharacterized protein n=1 Tax=Vibrio thalassae TaxID=1243014 RepID=A0A240EN44_9VIBR|nr:hypothetical protein VTH8203_03037 [Vibrio thalassae]